MSEDFLISIIGGLIVVLLAIVGWLTKRSIQRLDRVEEQKANKESTDARFESISRVIDRHIDDDKKIHERIYDSLDKMNTSLNEANISLAKIAARSDL